MLLWHYDLNLFCLISFNKILFIISINCVQLIYDNMHNYIAVIIYSTRLVLMLMLEPKEIMWLNVTQADEWFIFFDLAVLLTSLYGIIKLF